MEIISKNFVENPLVSIVIPSYNRADTVSQTINSIVNQQCDFDFEIIIGDDCSTDNAQDILLSYQSGYPSIIKLLFHDENIGLGANWATCIKQCRGKYIANCDNDDYWHNLQKLQLQVEFMEQNPKYGLCHTDYRVLNRSTGKLTAHICQNTLKRKERERETTTIQSLMRGIGCNASVIYKKNELLQYVNMDDYIKYRFSLQDWNTWMLLSPFTEFGCLHVSTATFGVEKSSITRPKSINALEKRWQGQKECYKYICEKLPTYYPYLEKEFDDHVNVICLNYSFETFDYRNAKKYALRCNPSFKVRCAKHSLLFYFYAIAGKLKRSFSLLFSLIRL